MVNAITNRTAARLSMATGAALVAMLFAGPAAAAERMNDNDVKQLLERIDQERDRFEDQLDGKLKGSIIRGPGGEVKVEKYLDDLQDNVDKLKDRFKSDYAASAEVTTILRQGSDIQRYMSTLPPNYDGASEWTRLAGSLGELAKVYGTTFPLPEGHQARRMNDSEVRKVADNVAKAADRYKKELDSSLKNNTSIDNATRETSVKQADELKKVAEKLESTIGDGKPASGEAQALLQQASAVKAAATGRPLSAAAQTELKSVESDVAIVAQAFGLPGRP